MRITRFPQSCLLVEHNGRKLVIDPGENFLTTHKQEELSGVETVLYTHQHADHFSAGIAGFLTAQGVQFICNMATAGLLGDGDVTIVNDGDEFMAAGMHAVARELPHCPMPDGTAGPQNTGYVIEGVLFHPGDGKELSGLTVENVALPIQGPDVSFRDANDFAKQLQAKLVIPIHYDFMGADPKVFKMFAGGSEALGIAPMPFEVRVLGDGEHTDLS